jgi:hypothetical protein
MSLTISHDKERTGEWDKMSSTHKNPPNGASFPWPMRCKESFPCLFPLINWYSLSHEPMKVEGDWWSSNHDCLQSHQPMKLEKNPSYESFFF